jgi:hypothetical protein
MDCGRRPFKKGQLTLLRHEKQESTRQKLTKQNYENSKALIRHAQANNDFEVDPLKGKSKT